MKKCPYCGEEIQDEAIKCKHCAEWISKVDSGFYRALLSHQLHQDRLLWSRAQLLIAVQAGALASGFSLRDSWEGPIIMLFGAVFTFFVFVLLLKDQSDRDVNQEILDKLADKLLPEEIKNEINNEIDQLNAKGKLTKGEHKRLDKFQKYKEKDRYIWFGSPSLPKWRSKWGRGRYIILGIIILFIVINLALAGYYQWGNSLPNQHKSLTKVIQIFDKGYGGPLMDEIAEYTTPKFRDNKPKSVWVMDTWKTLKKMEYQRLNNSIINSKVKDDKAVIVTEAKIKTVAGETTQKEIYYLVKEGERSLIDELIVTDEEIDVDKIKL